MVLGCTELVLAVDVRANVLPVYDTTAIHARAAVDWMLADEEAGAGRGLRRGVLKGVEWRRRDACAAIVPLLRDVVAARLRLWT